MVDKGQRKKRATEQRGETAEQRNPEPRSMTPVCGGRRNRSVWSVGCSNLGPERLRRLGEEFRDWGQRGPTQMSGPGGCGSPSGPLVYVNRARSRLFLTRRHLLRGFTLQLVSHSFSPSMHRSSRVWLRIDIAVALWSLDFRIGPVFRIFFVNIEG